MKLRIHPIQRGVHILDFTVAIIMLALTQSGSAEVETQDGKSEAVQRLHGMKDNFVMQRSAKQRMRMADDSRVRRLLCSGVEKSFQASGGALQKQ